MQDPTVTTGCMGLCLFLAGLIGNISHDCILAGLRRSKGKGYHLPQGLLYDYVSFPNYLCEWIEWCGYAMVQRQPEGTSHRFSTRQCSYVLTAIWFIILEVAVMMPRALTGHALYRERFGRDMPLERTAILPFVL